MTEPPSSNSREGAQPYSKVRVGYSSRLRRTTHHVKMKQNTPERVKATAERTLALAHRAQPTHKEAEGAWETRCGRAGCERTFTTDSRERRYCSGRCRRLIEQARAHQSSRVSALLLRIRSATNCTKAFLPTHAAHQYCSSRCRKRAYRKQTDSPVREGQLEAAPLSPVQVQWL